MLITRIDLTKGVIDWPDRISTQYVDKTSQLDDLFQIWASGRDGLGSMNYSDITHGCDELILRMKHDLRQKRFTAPEYIHLTAITPLGEAECEVGNLRRSFPSDDPRVGGDIVTLATGLPTSQIIDLRRDERERLPATCSSVQI